MSTPESRARAAAYMRDWNARNRDRVEERRLQRYAANQNGVRDRAIHRARLFELRKRGGVDSETEEMVPILKRDPCVYCGEQVLLEQQCGEGSSLDHIDSQGDSHWTNLAGCCRSCNAAKGKVPLLLSLLERQIRRDFVPLAEQLWIIKRRNGQRRRIDF